MQLKLYSAKEVDELVDKLSNDPIYGVKLELEQVTFSTPALPTGATVPKPKEDVAVAKFIEGTAPYEYLNQATHGSVICEMFSLKNNQVYSKLSEYLWINGRFELSPVQRRGSCLFAAVRRNLDVPEEYTNCHLRRQMVAFLATNKEYFYTYLMDYIKGEYGHKRLSDLEYRKKEAEGTLTQEEIDDQLVPGPFSYSSYLKYMLLPSSWGDEMTLCILSLMWQLSITVIHAETLFQTRIRHDTSFKAADILLVYCSRSHYVAACK